MTRKHLDQRAKELFAYLYLSGPTLPPEDGTTIEGEFRKLRNVIALMSDYVKEDDAKRFLKFCDEELALALKYYLESNEDKGLVHIQEAERWMNEARKGAKSKPRFFVDPSGVVKDTDQSQ